ncbi:hypothetical protein PVAP13_1NG302219 [Panicum virgatum]|uniref:Uncharacterized protein n=1 Tax=Panicum virgatum TaxID=38727 RepID=A0A8T0X800_PANVG|nr:hypothetical protein PVAP13_1NG302219 [Panicum virgatum]
MSYSTSYPVFRREKRKKSLQPASHPLPKDRRALILDLQTPTSRRPSPGSHPSGGATATPSRARTDAIAARSESGSAAGTGAMPAPLSAHAKTEPPWSGIRGRSPAEEAGHKDGRLPGPAGPGGRGQRAELLLPQAAGGARGAQGGADAGARWTRGQGAAAQGRDRAGLFRPPAGSAPCRRERMEGQGGRREEQEFQAAC